MSLDAIDLRILRHLQQDGRMSNQDLAEKVSLSPSACLRPAPAGKRGSSAATRWNWMPSDWAWNWKPSSMCRCARTSRVGTGVHRQGRDWPEVVTAYVVTGATNYVLRVRARNLKHYSDFIVNKLNRAAGVTDIRSEIVLQEIKAGADLLDLVNLKS